MPFFFKVAHMGEIKNMLRIEQICQRKSNCSLCESTFHRLNNVTNWAMVSTFSDVATVAQQYNL